MAKEHYEKTMSFKDDNGNEHDVRLYWKRTSHGTTEYAECEGKVGKYSWVNRPWQSFDYESAMIALIDKLPTAWRENATLKLIKGESERIHAECDAFFNAFQSNYGKLSDEAKQSLAENAPMVETKEQAEAMACIVGVMAALGM